LLEAQRLYVSYMTLVKSNNDIESYGRDMSEPDKIPRLPALLACGLRFAPLAPLRLACERLAISLTRRRPRLFERLGEHAQKSVTIDPIDLPVMFRLTPDPDRPRLEVARQFAPDMSDARIAGPLAALLGLIHGAYDGDALFFSRDLTIEGDTALVVALRNALDNEELNLADEAAALFGPLSSIIARPLGQASQIAERLTGVTLTRHRFS
jgi:O2-independent ubiquinone biosynthesis accessory factor UbiT